MIFFIRKICGFLFYAFVIVSILVITTKTLAKNAFEFTIPKEKNVLILGNSKPECAIDDTILSNSFNLAQGGNAYFYEYLKLKPLIERNSQIKTLVLGYSYGDISNEMDKWCSSEKKIKFKLRDYFFLFSFEDYLSLLKSNPISVLKNTPQTILHNIKMMYADFKNLGGHQKLKRDKLVEAKKILEQGNRTTDKAISQYQTRYLQKIYDYCLSKEIKIVLLAIPIHPKEVESRKDLIPVFNEFANVHMPKAVLIDHSNFNIPESFYSDLTHLNLKGSNFYSKYLAQNDVLKLQR